MSAARPGGGPSVLFLATTMGVGGVEILTWRRAKWMVDRGLPAAIASADGELVAAVRESGVPHFLLPELRDPSFSPAALQRAVDGLSGLIREEGFAVVTTGHPIPSLYGYAAALEAGVPFVLEIASNLPGYALPGDCFHRLGREIEQGGGLTALAAYDAQVWARRMRVSLERVRMIGTVIECDRFRPMKPPAGLREELGIRPAERVVVCVGRFNVDKLGYLLPLIGEFARVAREVPNLCLLLVGDGDREPVERAIREAEPLLRAAGARILLAGERRDVPEVLSLGELFVGQGGSALEAAACGRPVILAGVPQTELEGACVGFYGPESHFSVGGGYPGCVPRPFGEPLLQLLRDPEGARRMGLRNRELILERNDIDRVMTGFLEYCAGLDGRSWSGSAHAALWESLAEYFLHKADPAACLHALRRLRKLTPGAALQTGARLAGVAAATALTRPRLLAPFCARLAANVSRRPAGRASGSRAP